MTDRCRISVGFAGGQVLPLRVTGEKLDALRSALSSSSESWHEVEADDGPVLLNLGKVVFLRVDADEQRVGF